MNRYGWWGLLALCVITVTASNITLPVTARDWMHVTRRPIEMVSDQIARESVWYRQTQKDYDQCLAEQKRCDHRALQARLDEIARKTWPDVLPKLNEVPWGKSARSLADQNIYTAALAKYGDLSACTPRFSYWQGAGPSIEPRLDAVECPE